MGFVFTKRLSQKSFEKKKKVFAEDASGLESGPQICYAQVIKRYQKRHVVEVERRVIKGKDEVVESLRHKASNESVINTAFIERLNATIRQRLSNFVRRTRAVARQVTTIEDGMWLFGSIYNFCTPHDSLQICTEIDQQNRYINRTPAMAAGITDHI